MKEFEFKPETKGFEGTIRVKVLNYSERIALAKEIDTKTNEKGEVEPTTELEEALKNLQKLKDLVVSVNLKFEDTEINTIDDLEYYEEGMAVIKELQHIAVKGIKLGKNSLPPSENHSGAAEQQ